MSEFRKYLTEGSKHSKDFMKLIKAPRFFLEELMSDMEDKIQSLDDNDRQKKILEKQADVLNNALDKLISAEDNALFVLKDIKI